MWPAANAFAELDAAEDPFSFADFTWIPGNSRTHTSPLTLGDVFTGEFRADVAYHDSFAAPKGNTIVGSSEVFRHNEIQVTQLGLGGDIHIKNVQGRVMTQFGQYSMTTPRNDASPSRGQWDLANAYRYISEADGGYHFDVLKGINLQAGIFMSYVGLWSYDNADNWTYQPSYVSSNMPWFFNGMRAQIFVTSKLKIGPWLVNGFQAYGKFNDGFGGGGQIMWNPTGWFSFTGNQYYGTDTLGNANRKRIHTDGSIKVKYDDNPDNFISKAAASFTFDAGCEWGDGVVGCDSQYFIGAMAYNRLWFSHDHLGLTTGGGAITNPGRYLVLVPPINGATASSGAAPYFTANPGDKFTAWDLQVTADWMPEEFITFRLEYNHRWASVPYFAGSGGVTPPGGNTGTPGSTAEGWAPDLRQTEDRMTVALLVKI